MESEQFTFETIEQQQAVFGVRDSFVRIIEKGLSVSISLRDSVAEIEGGTLSAVKRTRDVLQSLLRLHQDGEKLDEDTVFRMMELACEGALDDTLEAMGDAVIRAYRGQPVKCKTLGQKAYVRALRDNVVTICIGPAGTGKTFLAVAQACKELEEGAIERIIMSRPAIEAGEERLGFLPGDLSQKVDPYLRPLYDALYDILGAEKAKKLQERGTIEIAPLAYMRGRTLNHARVIIDESQNASLSTLKMALTRIGEGSKMVLTGDVTQIDLPRMVESGLEKCAAILDSVEDIAVTRLGNRDVVRNKTVKEIVKAFEREEKQQKDRREKNGTDAGRNSRDLKGGRVKPVRRKG